MCFHMCEESDIIFGLRMQYLCEKNIVICFLSSEIDCVLIYKLQ